ncbi:hypothetical protein CO057_00455 [Candidatus Uhrbacteria bacterium CG_4_9_14_0_2_um_filter_41_50]|uniref:Antitoxin n=1 Tax=Candidatus Uhrbacteria bacterium CG_4_9_14_0_2_um_filter_41_50 TaxID=1975031 RepID=A0A2M8EQ61_9BACT|nr:MAG: hypothetical protein COZ45_02230 [Candidatus Uhrbacteria bacterium CG_4_10_14_3_um_filter_41_21]PIZ54484.1 MAG: hypothetical protein COY24_03590 [Candidatus Uhrbacteria bacterium CG_4_10_14_0_2_um_filter_41_21]PJB84834.1 MAG: hypothetical protein CO086_01435 [Candidatus Uhrbacteria bacterium CG_4_9_14_0_8_um_filter_41_16]PJC24879.1 MAG: hypothetical protein CO057_00455 [Candidatus Uhrbacteria bacterium CG_4_9_14_0_2_um_filter_41_50]PJE75219.1 MAG: hypothetical protein COV03_01095 [Candi
MNNIITLKDLRQNVQKYADRVEQGDTFLVMKKSKPLFKISPAEDENWEVVVDFTKINKGGVDIDDILTRL